jgi:hypothetical protein
MASRGGFQSRGGGFSGGRGRGGFGGSGGSHLPRTKSSMQRVVTICRSRWLSTILRTPSFSIWYDRLSAMSIQSTSSNSLEEMGSFLHSCEGEIVCESVNPKIPYFNAPIFLENKVRITGAIIHMDST